jgi:hypothetical protein
MSYCSKSGINKGDADHSNAEKLEPLWTKSSRSILRCIENHLIMPPKSFEKGMRRVVMNWCW